MRNNPVNFNDPSGHCSGDRNGDDKACWDLWYGIQAEFTNITLNNAIFWSLHELQMLSGALNRVLNLFQNKMDVFKAQFGNFSIVKLPVDSLFGSGGGLTPPGAGVIYLTNSIFYLSDGSKRGDYFEMFSIVHELGHIFDFNATRNSFEYWSEEFVLKYGPRGCKTGWLGCIGTNTYYPQIVWGGADNSYNPGSGTTAVGASASVDDFAESFAVVVMGDGPFKVSDDRKNLIMSLITKLVK